MQFSTIDVETGCDVTLARKTLQLGRDVGDREVYRRLLERNVSRTGRDFPTLSHHRPVAAGVLMSERADDDPATPVLPELLRTWGREIAAVPNLLEGIFLGIEDGTLIGFDSSFFALPLIEQWSSHYGIAALPPAEYLDSSLRGNQGVDGGRLRARVHSRIPAKASDPSTSVRAAREASGDKRRSA